MPWFHISSGTRMKQYTFSANAFKKYYLPIFFLMITPSLIMDGVILYRMITHHPVILSDSGHINLPFAIQLFLINAVLLKGWAIVWLIIKRRNASKSWVIIKKGTIIFRRHIFFPSEWHFDDPTAIEYRITKISTVYFHKKYLKVVGDIEKYWLNENNEPLRAKSISECCIPAWFQAIDDLYITLNAFMIRKLA
jgi:hypothetical protein